MRQADIRAAGVLIAAGLVTIVFVIPRQTTPGNTFGLPPAFMPTLTMAIVVGLSVLLLLRSLIARNDTRPAPILAAEWWLLLKTGSLMLMAVIGVDVLGLPIGGGLGVAAFMVYLGERRPLPILATSIGTAGAVWALLVYVLKLPL
jgi:hypothetical protein